MHGAVPPPTNGSRVSVAQHKEVVPFRTRLMLNVREARRGELAGVKSVKAETRRCGDQSRAEEISYPGLPDLEHCRPHDTVDRDRPYPPLSLLTIRDPKAEAGDDED